MKRIKRKTLDSVRSVRSVQENRKRKKEPKKEIDKRQKITMDLVSQKLPKIIPKSDGQFCKRKKEAKKEK